jgi:hypothetical protein
MTVFFRTGAFQEPGVEKDSLLLKQKPCQERTKKRFFSISMDRQPFFAEKPGFQADKTGESNQKRAKTGFGTGFSHKPPGILLHLRREKNRVPTFLLNGRAAS